MSFYLMHRGWMDNPAFRNEPYNRRDAFCWLIENAAFRDGVKVPLPKGDITLNRGQLTYSNRYLAQAWRWTEPRVRRCLKLFQSRSMIELKTDAGQNVITICKYDDYQDIRRTIDAATDAAATQDRRSSDANKKEGKPLKPLEDDVNGSGYAFKGEVIRLNENDFHRWQKAYPAIPDLRAELTSLDDYFRTENPKNWFAAVSGALRKRNNQYLDGKKQAAHKMTDAEYNAVHNDLVTSNPLGAPQ